MWLPHRDEMTSTATLNLTATAVERESFRERFCRQFGCSGEEFEHEALRRFLYPPWGALTALYPAAFRVDRVIVARLGEIKEFEHLAHEIRDIRADYHRESDFGFERRMLKRRLSSKRILETAAPLWGRRSRER